MPPVILQVPPLTLMGLEKVPPEISQVAFVVTFIVPRTVPPLIYKGQTVLESYLVVKSLSTVPPEI